MPNYSPKRKGQLCTLEAVKFSKKRTLYLEPSHYTWKSLEAISFAQKAEKFVRRLADALDRPVAQPRITEHDITYYYNVNCTVQHQRDD